MTCNSTDAVDFGQCDMNDECCDCYECCLGAENC
ncbi:Hypothetical protein LUCI_4416 [Lucifera butyrica]|uniref:Uncharacterized protein n=1 Tax=Lucifera butyrica TaxID=1351585 RepID=A0A498RE84_9FIRM|nr:Hypothetical protein LUCI_4416 [Lucifera butyrica]